MIYDRQRELLGGERKEVLNEEDYYMSIALITSARSYDPSTQVGSCIVGENGIISTGFNQPSMGWPNYAFPWGRDESKGRENTKYPFVVHSEADAISNKDCRGATCYVTLFPCNECAKALARAGIKKVVYLRRPEEYEKMIESLEIFEYAGIEVVQYDGIKLRGFGGIDYNVNSETKDNVKIKHRIRLKIPKNGIGYM